MDHQLIFQIEDFCLTNVLQNLGQKISLWSCHSLAPKLWCSKSVSYKILSSLDLKPSTAKKFVFETCDISSSANFKLDATDDFLSGGTSHILCQCRGTMYLLSAHLILHSV